MDAERKEQYKINRQIRAAEAREKANRKRAVRFALEDIIISADTTKKEKLEAANLLAELSKSFYY